MMTLVKTRVSRFSFKISGENQIEKKMKLYYIPDWRRFKNVLEK